MIRNSPWDPRRRFDRNAATKAGAFLPARRSVCRRTQAGAMVFRWQMRRENRPPTRTSRQRLASPSRSKTTHAASSTPSRPPPELPRAGPPPSCPSRHSRSGPRALGVVRLSAHVLEEWRALISSPAPQLGFRHSTLPSLVASTSSALMWTTFRWRVRVLIECVGTGRFDLG